MKFAYKQKVIITADNNFYKGQKGYILSVETKNIPNSITLIKYLVELDDGFKLREYFREIDLAEAPKGMLG